MSAFDIQEGGDHYKRLAIQPTEFALANKLAFVEGNVVKYVTRWQDKGGVEDLRKARHYLDLLIEHTEAAAAAAIQPTLPFPPVSDGITYDLFNVDLNKETACG